MNRTKGRHVSGVILALVWLLMLFQAAGAVLPGGMAEEEPQYVENEWNFVDGSMDTSNGIPEDVTGRLAKIRSAGKLTVATEPYYPPQEFIDETKSGQARFVGADMELARLIAERMGVELVIVPLDFTEVLNSVADGKYDLAIAALSFTSGRASMLEMSKGYYFTAEEASSGLIIREEDAGDIRQVEDLATLDIVAMSGSLQETVAAESIAYYHKFRRLPTVNDVYTAVMAGKAHVGVVDVENARAYIENHPDCGLVIVPDVSFKLEQQYKGDRVAAAKGELELIYFVNGVIDEVVKSGQYERWFEAYSEFDND